MDERMADLVTRLTRYGRARDRMVDHEPRTVTITDDEAVMLLDAFERLGWHRL